MIEAVVTQNPNGNEIRCETLNTKQIVWCQPDEIKEVADDSKAVSVFRQG